MPTAIRRWVELLRKYEPQALPKAAAPSPCRRPMLCRSIGLATNAAACRFRFSDLLPTGRPYVE